MNIYIVIPNPALPKFLIYTFPNHSYPSIWKINKKKGYYLKLKTKISKLIANQKPL